MQYQPPAISIIMANYNGAGSVAAAVRSVLRQTETSIELIFSDDGSSDTSLAEAKAAAAGDPRFVAINGGPRSGPAATRNRAIAAARGRWLAVVDSDDFIHPDRLERVVRAAEADGADIAADDMLVFYDDAPAAPHPMLKGPLTRAPAWISAADYAAANALNGSRPALGYLKPIIRRTRLGALRYDESLRIAEDFDLVMRLLLGGARMRVYPEIGYFYRKHAKSISHRLTGAHVAAMLHAHDALGAPADPATQRGFAQRHASLVTALAFSELIEALKARKIGAALAVAAKRPQAAALLRQPVLARLARIVARPARRATSAQPRIALLSRQRVVGATNGSSAYLISIVQTLKEAGYAIDFIGASPKLFGRWPFLRLNADTDVFASYQVHGGWRIARVMFSRDPRRMAAAALAVAEKAAAKLKIATKGWSSAAEYSIGAQATRADMIFVARAVRPNTRAVLCDYGFLTPLAPFALAPDMPTLVVMHDLFSARVRDEADGVARLTPEEEWRLLGQADIVLAIQQTEAEAVRAALPHTGIIVAPHAVKPAATPQAGRDATLLFVGSNTGPNISGLQWFFDACWPLIRAAQPDMTLDVAGSVARGLDGAPAGVRLLGVVPDLAALYRDAGVVISPLRTGSGLKIKLIEAMAAGKAIVGTTITLQGVEDVAGDAVLTTDEPGALAQFVVGLAASAAARDELGRKALVCAEAHFSANACYGELLGALRNLSAPTP